MPDPPQALAVRAVALAARWVVRSRRLEMQALADALGVSRVTLFRQVGAREELLGKTLALLTQESLAAAQRRWESVRPPGQPHSIGIGHLFNEEVSRAPGLRRLLDDEPAITMRVLTDPRGPVQGLVVAFFAEILRRDVAEFGLHPTVDLDDLAYALVRLGESFVYADILASRNPDVHTANRLQETLVEGQLRYPR